MTKLQVKVKHFVTYTDVAFIEISYIWWQKKKKSFLMIVLIYKCVVIIQMNIIKRNFDIFTTKSVMNEYGKKNRFSQKILWI